MTLLRLVGGKENGEIVPIKADRIFIGKDKSCHLRIEHSSISPKHCVITKRNGKATIRNLAHSYPTLLNGKEIGFQEHVLYEDDIITIMHRNFKWTNSVNEFSQKEENTLKKRKSEPMIKNGRTLQTPPRNPLLAGLQVFVSPFIMGARNLLKGRPDSKINNNINMAKTILKRKTGSSKSPRFVNSKNVKENSSKAVNVNSPDVFSTPPSFFKDKTPLSESKGSAKSFANSPKSPFLVNAQKRETPKKSNFPAVKLFSKKTGKNVQRLSTPGKTKILSSDKGGRKSTPGKISLKDYQNSKKSTLSSPKKSSPSYVPKPKFRKSGKESDSKKSQKRSSFPTSKSGKETRDKSEKRRMSMPSVAKAKKPRLSTPHVVGVTKSRSSTPSSAKANKPKPSRPSLSKAAKSKSSTPLLAKPGGSSSSKVAKSRSSTPLSATSSKPRLSKPTSSNVTKSRSSTPSAKAKKISSSASKAKKRSLSTPSKTKAKRPRLSTPLKVVSPHLRGKTSDQRGKRKSSNIKPGKKVSLLSSRKNSPSFTPTPKFRKAKNLKDRRLSTPTKRKSVKSTGKAAKLRKSTPGKRFSSPTSSVKPNVKKTGTNLESAGKSSSKESVKIQLPKSVDKKKNAALLACHKRGPNASIKRPLFSEVLKAAVTPHKAASAKKASRTAKTKSSKQVISPKVRFPSRHVNSPDPIVIGHTNLLTPESHSRNGGSCEIGVGAFYGKKGGDVLAALSLMPKMPSPLPPSPGTLRRKSLRSRSLVIQDPAPRKSHSPKKLPLKMPATPDVPVKSPNAPGSARKSLLKKTPRKSPGYRVTIVEPNKEYKYSQTLRSVRESSYSSEIYSPSRSVSDLSVSFSSFNSPTLRLSSNLSGFMTPTGLSSSLGSSKKSSLKKRNQSVNFDNSHASTQTASPKESPHHLSSAHATCQTLQSSYKRKSSHVGTQMPSSPKKTSTPFNVSTQTTQTPVSSVKNRTPFSISTQTPAGNRVDFTPTTSSLNMGTQTKSSSRRSLLPLLKAQKQSYVLSRLSSDLAPSFLSPVRSRERSLSSPSVNSSHLEHQRRSSSTSELADRSAVKSEKGAHFEKIMKRLSSDFSDSFLSPPESRKGSLSSPNKVDVTTNSKRGSDSSFSSAKLSQSIEVVAESPLGPTPRKGRTKNVNDSQKVPKMLKILSSDLTSSFLTSSPGLGKRSLSAPARETTQKVGSPAQSTPEKRSKNKSQVETSHGRNKGAENIKDSPQVQAVLKKLSSDFTMSFLSPPGSRKRSLSSPAFNTLRKVDTPTSSRRGSEDAKKGSSSPDKQAKSNVSKVEIPVQGLLNSSQKVPKMLKNLSSDLTPSFLSSPRLGKRNLSATAQKVGSPARGTLGKELENKSNVKTPLGRNKSATNMKDSSPVQAVQKKLASDFTPSFLSSPGSRMRSLSSPGGNTSLKVDSPSRPGRGSEPTRKSFSSPEKQSISNQPKVKTPPGRSRSDEKLSNSAKVLAIQKMLSSDFTPSFLSSSGSRKRSLSTPAGGTSCKVTSLSRPSRGSEPTRKSSSSPEKQSTANQPKDKTPPGKSRNAEKISDSAKILAIQRMLSSDFTPSFLSSSGSRKRSLSTPAGRTSRKVDSPSQAARGSEPTRKSSPEKKLISNQLKVKTPPRRSRSIEKLSKVLAVQKMLSSDFTPSFLSSSRSRNNHLSSPAGKISRKVNSPTRSGQGPESPRKSSSSPDKQTRPSKPKVETPISRTPTGLNKTSENLRDSPKVLAMLKNLSSDFTQSFLSLTGSRKRSLSSGAFESPSSRQKLKAFSPRKEPPGLADRSRGSPCSLSNLTLAQSHNISVDAFVSPLSAKLEESTSPVSISVGSAKRKGRSGLCSSTPLTLPRLHQKEIFSMSDEVGPDGNVSEVKKMFQEATHKTSSLDVQGVRELFVPEIIGKQQGTSALGEGRENELIEARITRNMRSGKGNKVEVPRQGHGKGTSRKRQGKDLAGKSDLMEPVQEIPNKKRKMRATSSELSSKEDILSESPPSRTTRARAGKKTPKPTKEKDNLRMHDEGASRTRVLTSRNAAHTSLNLQPIPVKSPKLTRKGRAVKKVTIASPEVQTSPNDLSTSSTVPSKGSQVRKTSKSTKKDRTKSSSEGATRGTAQKGDPKGGPSKQGKVTGNSGEVLFSDRSSETSPVMKNSQGLTPKQKNKVQSPPKKPGRSTRQSANEGSSKELPNVKKNLRGSRSEQNTQSQSSPVKKTLSGTGHQKKTQLSPAKAFSPQTGKRAVRGTVKKENLVEPPAETSSTDSSSKKSPVKRNLRSKQKIQVLLSPKKAGSPMKQSAAEKRSPVKRNPQGKKSKQKSQVQPSPKKVGRPTGVSAGEGSSKGPSIVKKNLRSSRSEQKAPALSSPAKKNSRGTRHQKKTQSSPAKAVSPQKGKRSVRGMVKKEKLVEPPPETSKRQVQPSPKKKVAPQSKPAEAQKTKGPGKIKKLSTSLASPVPVGKPHLRKTKGGKVQKVSSKTSNAGKNLRRSTSKNEKQVARRVTRRNRRT